MLSGYNHAIEKLENTSGGAGFFFLIALVGECKSFLSEQRNYPSVLFFFYYLRWKEVIKFSNAEVVNYRADALKKGPRAYGGGAELQSQVSPQEIMSAACIKMFSS